MNKRVGYVTAVLALLLAVTMAYNPAAAANYNNVGVKIGDRATYKVSVGGGAYNKSVIQIYGISAPNVNVNITNYKPNGSVYSKEWLNGSVATITGLMFGCLIAGGLSAGDDFTGDAVSINITKTETITAAGASRSCNYVNGTLPFLYLHNCYYDKETGLLVKGDLFILLGWGNLTLISTTAWSSGGLFGLSTETLLIIAVVAVILVAAIVLATRRGGKKKH